jgi:hypothetical protein
MTVLMNVSEDDVAIVFEREGEGPNFTVHPNPDTPKAELWLIKHYPAAAEPLKNGAGAQPVGDDVILVYKGQLYILPDKDIKGHMATHMVMDAAGAPNHGE